MSSTAPVKKGPTLGAMAVLGVLFANCIGSGYGFEQAVGSGGPFLTLMLCAFLPILYTFPTGLAVAELASSIPSKAGSTAWIDAAFHPIVSYYNILTSLFINLTANASYFALASSYFETVILSAQKQPSSNSAGMGTGGGAAEATVGLAPWIMALTKIMFALIGMGLNISGVEIIGTAALIISFITLFPFLSLFVCGATLFPFEPVAVRYVPTAVDWPTFLTIATWNFGSIDNIGSIIEDIIEPRKNLIKALIPLMFSYSFAYLFPVLFGVNAMYVASGLPGGAYQLWQPGFWTRVARVAAAGSEDSTSAFYYGAVTTLAPGATNGPGSSIEHGLWLRWVMLIGGVVSGLGYIVTMLCSSSRQLQGMAQMDYIFPRVVSKWLGMNHPRLGTPVVAIIVNTSVALLMCLTMKFDSLVAVQQVMYSIRLCLIFLAVIKERMLGTVSRNIQIRQGRSDVAAAEAAAAVTAVTTGGGEGPMRRGSPSPAASVGKESGVGPSRSTGEADEVFRHGSLQERPSADRRAQAAPGNDAPADGADGPNEQRHLLVTGAGADDNDDSKTVPSEPFRIPVKSNLGVIFVLLPPFIISALTATLGAQQQTLVLAASLSGIAFALGAGAVRHFWLMRSTPEYAASHADYHPQS